MQSRQYRTDWNVGDEKVKSVTFAEKNTYITQVECLRSTNVSPISRAVWSNIGGRYSPGNKCDHLLGTPVPKQRAVPMWQKEQRLEMSRCNDGKISSVNIESIFYALLPQLVANRFPITALLSVVTRISDMAGHVLGSHPAGLNLH